MRGPSKSQGINRDWVTVRCLIRKTEADIGTPYLNKSPASRGPKRLLFPREQNHGDYSEWSEYNEYSKGEPTNARGIEETLKQRLFVVIRKQVCRRCCGTVIPFVSHGNRPSDASRKCRSFGRVPTRVEKARTRAGPSCRARNESRQVSGRGSVWYPTFELRIPAGQP